MKPIKRYELRRRAASVHHRVTSSPFFQNASTTKKALKIKSAAKSQQGVTKEFLSDLGISDMASEHYKSSPFDKHLIILKLDESMF